MATNNLKDFTFRELVLGEILGYLLDDSGYANHLRQKNWTHESYVTTLKHLPDIMLYRIYKLLLEGRSIYFEWLLNEPFDCRDYINIRVNNMYGCLCDDGSIHT